MHNISSRVHRGRMLVKGVRSEKVTGNSQRMEIKLNKVD